MGNNEKTPEQLLADKLYESEVMLEAISHFSIKLGAIKNDMPIEEQIILLSKYYDVPSAEDIKGGRNNVDLYRKVFMDNLYNQYFRDFPEMLEYLGDKKSADNSVNFRALRVRAFVLGSPEEDESKRKERINKYYDILPKYIDYLIKFIVDNQKWELTINTKNAFLAYFEIEKEHKSILAKYPSPLDIPYLIRDVRENMIDKISTLKQLGIDDDTYNRVVSNVVIGKFLAFQYIMNEMAGGGSGVIGTVAGLFFQKYSLKDICSAVDEVEEKLVLDDQQKKQMDDVKKMLGFFRKEGFASSSSSGSGCMLVLLLMIIPTSLLAFLFC